MIPIGSPHKTNAETLINYYYDPEVAAEVAAYVNYICPVVGAKEEMAEDRQVARRQPADLPDGRRPRQGQDLPHASTPDEETKYTEAVPEGDRQLMAATPRAGGRRTCASSDVTKRFGTFTAVDDLST